VRDVVTGDQRAERLRDYLVIGLPDENPALGALAHGNQARSLQQLERLADDAETVAAALLQIALRVEASPGWVALGQQLVPQ